MSNTYTIPRIFTSFDMETGLHVLMADGVGGPAIAGERLLRAEPWPQIAWSHPTADAAERDAQTLRAYLEECASGQKKGERVCAAS